MKANRTENSTIHSYVRKYCQLFTHEWNAFLSVMTSIEAMLTQMPKNARNDATNSPFPLRHVDFHLTHECLGPPHSPPQTTSESNQPCCHCSHVRTDRWEGRMFYSNSALFNFSYSDRERRANNGYC